MANVNIVTGSAGFIGTHLCAALLERGVTVIGLDIKTGHDIRVCHLPDADVVYHLAAQTDAYYQNAVADADINILASLRIFKKYREKVVFASSAMVNYPTTPYAISKRAAEAYARYFGASIVRFPNIFGPGGHSVIDKFEEADVLQIFGNGEQRRTYAHVEKAVEALLTRRGFYILSGDDLSVNEIARKINKPRCYLLAREGDMADARQIEGMN